MRGCNLNEYRIGTHMTKMISATMLLLGASGLYQAHAAVTYGRLPFAFEANQGQADAAVDFVARGPGYGMSLDKGGMTLGLRGADGHEQVMRMRLEGAAAHASVQGDVKLPGLSNYFVGSDPKHWHAHIPNYAKVRYTGVYPGVDLVYYGNQGQLEYDFVVAPGADAGVVALSFPGAQQLAVGAEGDLVITGRQGSVVQHRPVIYQQVAGERRTVSGNYLIEGSQVRFQLGAYDHSLPLVIDPTLSYSSYLGGQDFDFADGVAVDAAGEAYITGLIYSPDLSRGSWDLGHGDDRDHDHAAAGKGDAFVAKFSRDGSQLLYITYLGGRSLDQGYGIAVDAAGEAYVTGVTHSRNFPVTGNALQSRFMSRTGENAFVAGLDEAGRLEYASYLGGSGNDTGRGIAVDANGLYVTGYTTSSDFPVTSGSLQPQLHGLQNAFVTKLDRRASRLEYSTLLGGNDYDFGFGIAVGPTGDAYVTGLTWGISSNTFPTTGNAFQRSYAGGGDAFVARVSADGSTLVYSTLLGGTGNDGGRAVAVDNQGYAYVSGFTQSTGFPTTSGVLQPALKGSEDAFVAKVKPDGSGLAYSTLLGGSGNDAAYGIAVSNGNAYVTGFTLSTDFPVTAGAIESANPWRAPFVATLNATGSSLLYSTLLGGSNGDGGYAIATDRNGNAYVAGYSNSIDMPVSLGAYQTQMQASATEDAFLAKISFAAAAQ